MTRIYDRYTADPEKAAAMERWANRLRRDNQRRPSSKRAATAEGVRRDRCSIEEEVRQRPLFSYPRGVKKKGGVATLFLPLKTKSSRLLAPMSSSSGGGRKRGRPPTTPEQRREKARLRQAGHRRRVADEQWARATNSGRYVDLDVPHWLDLLDFLTTIELLDPRNVENAPKIEDAVGELLTRHLNELWAWREEIGLGNSYFYSMEMPPHGPNFRPSSCEPGTVRFWIDADNVEPLEIDADDTRRIKAHLEDVLFRFYSAIEDWRRPDAYGIPWGSVSYGRGLEAFKTKPRRTPAWAREVDAVLRAYLDGGREQPEEMRLPDPETTWTKAEAMEAQRKAIIISRARMRDKEERPSADDDTGTPFGGACAEPIRVRHLLNDKRRRDAPAMACCSDWTRSRFLRKPPKV